MQGEPPQAAPAAPPSRAVPPPRPVPATPSASRPSGPATVATAPPPAPASPPTGQPALVPLPDRPPPAPQLTPPPRQEGIARVALLLPLSGPQGRLGNEMLDAAALALFDFADGNFELLLHDTKGTPQGAAEAAQFAVTDGAGLILGPLLAAEVKAAAPVARAAGINVVAFSNDRTAAGEGVFLMGFLPGAEVERVVAFARGRGLGRFAVLAPDNAYGATVVEALRRAAQAAGATVVRVESYDPGATDFSPVVRRLASYESRRQALAEQRKELEGRDDEIARKALERLSRMETLGDLPFDALLVADGGKRLQALAALLPFYDVDPGKIRMLGTGQWDEPGIWGEPALLGGWFAAAPREQRADFEERYRQTYGRPPPRLATLAYDATALAAVLAQGARGPDFSTAALTDPAGFLGRDGIFRFLPGGTVERGLAVMQVENRGFKVIARPPQSFPGPAN
jgi:ABC-type branched-subunit amino acid transport system substrate-binding protein